MQTSFHEEYIPAKGSVLQRLPAAVVSLLFILLILAMYTITVRQIGGVFVYPLDDSYVHLALARSLDLHHVWGIDGTSFASASSSPGWTVLLMFADWLLGLHLVNAIVLDVVFAIALLFAVDYRMRSFVPSVTLGFRYFTLLAIMFFTPLASLTMMGMEHVAQALSILLLFTFGAQIIALEPELPLPRRTVVFLLLSAFFAGAIRYEAVLAIVPICFLLCLRRRLGMALLVGLCSAIAPIAFGSYFHHESGLWLPFSVIAKAGIQPAHTIRYFIDKTIGLRTLVPAVALVWLLRFHTYRFWHASQLLLSLSFCIAVAHLAIAPVGWIMRYESYLVTVCLFSLCVAVAGFRSPRAVMEYAGRYMAQSSRPRRYATALLALVGLGLAYNMGRRAIRGIVEPIRASHDRFLEHVQMARFLSGAYDGDTVIVNDIGAIAFYSHAHLLDLIGLGSMEPTRAIHDHHPYKAAEVASWASSRHASIAVLQTQWPLVTNMIPPIWTKVETWTIPRNIVFPDHDISFFAVTPEKIPRLCAALAKFPLPAEDKVTFLLPGCGMGRRPL
jgi:hypothetical protein